MDDFTSIKEAKADARVEPASSSDIDVGQSTPTLHASAPPSWARYLPGPSPTYRFKGLSRSLSRIGVTACGCMIFLLSGYNVALMGGVSSLPQYLQVVGLTDGSRKTELLIGTINAMYWIGVIFGALGVGWLSDTIGRRRALVVCLLYATIIIPIFASLQGFAWGLALRLLNGVAVGAIDSVGLNWTAETADHKRRGLAIGTELVFAPTAASIAFFMVLSAFFVQFSTQIMVGVGLVSAYGILLFETGGFAPDLAALLTGGAIATQALFGIPGAFLADKMGRRRAMWVGALISAVILLLIGVCGYFVDKHAEMNPDLAKTYGLVIILPHSLSRVPELDTDLLVGYDSLGALHLPLRDLPGTVPHTREFNWYCRVRDIIVPSQHDWPDHVLCNRLWVVVLDLWFGFHCHICDILLHARNRRENTGGD
ncbi:uncharacterized protein NECHADRAFT_88021 [Fusarium vanettenii 77-13-4]|uniref:Major facilitator superfamily (MFS) profile domain-containing protein n=1 Tax=Fusarium vanettenii (strain ATCC MYA-4622 / CBS 123669 / FGSC 9596 / NRRL 45880 / 77-13-4) TaxID=660122 RepID=C7ZN93_FUSV7|nr:uncharacterized protein NECHADRAFT_88021 [Fusarium vanettenii 77-13-4]EEU34517.1 hypothetical protein NECHADRAFT_88021 [Fusarium vanettenii 77-13-4]